jgi:hypothetical protein
MSDEAKPKKRTRKIRIRVRGQLDGAGGMQEGTITIDPTLGVVTVRPLRKHTSYTKSLTEVADWICKSVLLGRRGHS